MEKFRNYYIILLTFLLAYWFNETQNIVVGAATFFCIVTLVFLFLRWSERVESE